MTETVELSEKNEKFTKALIIKLQKTSDEEKNLKAAR